MSKDTGGPALLFGKRCTHITKKEVGCCSDGSILYDEDRREVVLMAMSGRYAMVRRTRCAPYICLVKELEPK